VLQFIVLGLIPGTTIQMNFGDVLRTALALFMLLILVREFHRYRLHVKAGGKLFSFLSKQT